jgi:hypothetical protein
MSFGTKVRSQLIERGNRIAGLITQTGMLDIPVHFQVVGEQANALAVRFTLNEETYSSATYFLETEGVYSQRLSATGIGVNSNLGKRTGTLMFHMTLLLAIFNDAAVFYLDNFTDVPERAALGIYSLLDVDKTISRHGTARSEFAGLSLADQLHLSEGGMRLIIDASTMARWKNKMNELATQVSTFGSPWVQPVQQKMALFLTLISQFSEASGGRKKTKKRRFSQKSTKKTRKKRKKTKNKKRKWKSHIQK